MTRTEFLLTSPISDLDRDKLRRYYRENMDNNERRHALCDLFGCEIFADIEAQKHPCPHRRVGYKQGRFLCQLAIDQSRGRLGFAVDCPYISSPCQDPINPEVHGK